MGRTKSFTDGVKKHFKQQKQYGQDCIQEVNHSWAHIRNSTLLTLIKFKLHKEEQTEMELEDELDLRACIALSGK